MSRPAWFLKTLRFHHLSLNAMVAKLGAGCSGSTRDRVLKFAESKSLDQLKSSFSKTMSIANSSSEQGGGGGPKISFVNGAWVDKLFPLKPSYQRRLTDTFKSEAQIHDFINQVDKAVSDINPWAESQTNGLITNVIQPGHITREPPEPPTAVILANALYFRGSWVDKFDTKWTQKRDFYLLNGDKISKVPFMTSSNSYLYGSFDDFKVLEIPYQRGKEAKNEFSMTLILPHAHERDGLQNLLENLDADPGCLSCRSFELRETVLDAFWIPKFKFSYTAENIEFPLMGEDMNLTEMFQQVEGVPLNFNIIQKASVEVDDEEGTEAAAVTTVGVHGCPRVQEKREIKSFVANHPFIFIIKEKTSGLVLFVGAVLNPLKD